MPPTREVEPPRFIEIDGRRWRATDPTIPEPFRQELVDELMRARRAVAGAHRADDEDALGEARRQVHAAKVALGERGDPWWEPTTDDGRRERIEAAVLTLAAHRSPDGSICPSDAARAIGGTGWRSLVPEVRDASRDLARTGHIRVTQGSTALDPDQPWKGPVRIRLGPDHPSS